MRGGVRRAFALGTTAIVAGVVSVGCVSIPMPTPSASTGGSPPLSSYYGQKLNWRSCSGKFECAKLKVPKDYSDTAVGDFRLDVVRLPASGDQRLGSLVLNPGGPGGSGVEYARAAQYVVSDDVRQAYDVVGFDPRGVGESDPVECLTDEQTDAFLAEDAEPEDRAEAERLAAEAAAVGKSCADRSPDIYRYMDTVSVAKDLDVLRAALGDPKLNYLGKSYGTLIGATYAELFGPKVGRMVLDGVLPPDLTAEQIGLGQAVGFEQELRRFVRHCQQQSSCPLPKGSVDKGVARIDAFLDSLETKPLPAQEGRPLTQSLALGAVASYLYFPFFGDWDKLSEGLDQAFKGDGSMLESLYDERLEREPDGRYRNNSSESFYAVTCLDRAADANLDVLEKRAKQWSVPAPTFGPYLAWSDLVCGQWPTRATGKPHAIRAPGSGPILVVSTTHDPATPLKWAQSLASQLADGHLVTWDTDGHTAYRNGSACVDRAVDNYLLKGQLPKGRLSC